MKHFWLAGLAGLGAGCGSDVAVGDAHLALVDRAASLVVEIAEPPPVPDGIALEWSREGLAGIRLTIETAGGATSREGARRLVTWPLPLPVARHPGGAELQARITGASIPLFVPGLKPDAGQKAGFWIDGDRLTVAHLLAEPLPERFELVYPVLAARFAGTALAAGRPPEEVFRVTRLRDRVAVECLVVPGGATLRLPLPRLPAGRFELTLAAVRSDAGSAPVVALRLDGEELHRGAPEADGSTIVLPTGPTAGEAVLEIEVEGGPGSIVFVESPLHRRERGGDDPPNVILIVIDTLRADRLGAYGHAGGLSPNLDRLAAEALRFEQCWSTSSWTLPSIASMLTSTHASQHRAWLDDKRLGRGLTTLPEAFRLRGYRTHAITDGSFVGPTFGLGRGFMTFDARGGGVEAIVERGEEFLARAGGGPWFLMLHTYEVHAPYEPPDDVYASVLARNPDGLLGRTPEPHRFYDFAEEGRPVPDHVVKTLEELYAEELRYTDEVLARFLATLRAAGLYDEAVICVTSDHGEEFGEHGQVGHADSLYVEELHVPLLVRLPGGARAGEVDRDPCSLLDLGPTLLDAAGLGELVAETTFVGGSLLGPTRGRSPVYALRNSVEVGALRLLRVDERVLIRGRYMRHRPRGARDEKEYYDLLRDPRQQASDFSGAAQGFADVLELRLERLAETYGEPLAEESDASIDARAAVELRKLGY